MGFAAATLTGQVTRVAAVARRATPINPVLVIILLCLVTGSRGQSNDPSVEQSPSPGAMGLIITGLCAALTSAVVHGMVAVGRSTRNGEPLPKANTGGVPTQRGPHDKPPVQASDTNAPHRN